MIYNDVIIESGASLTIQNVTVWFTGRTRIIVKRGAKLVVDNAILTVICDYVMWEGIEVWGNPAYSHPTVSVLTAPGYQPGTQENGLVIVTDSEIQYAGNGIKTVKEANFATANQFRDYNFVNGIALVSGSKFYNNGCSMVMFGNYMDVVSNATNTDFVVDNLFHDPNQVFGPGAAPLVQIYMQKIKGFKVDDGSIFDNQRGYSAGGDCIKTYDSSYTIDGGNHFYNWDDAIISIVSAPNPSIGQVLISGNTFENNYRAILLQGYDQDFFVNDFSIILSYNTIKLAQSQSIENYGIDLHGCSDYNVENNFIDGGGDFLYGEGIVLIASQPSTISYVQKNQFGTIPPASYEVGIRTFTSNETTQLICNNFNVDEDIDDPSFIRYGVDFFGLLQSDYPIAPIQGACDAAVADTNIPHTFPTGNTLSYTSNHIRFNDSSLGQDIEYNHFPNQEALSSNGRVIDIPCTDVTSSVCFNTLEPDPDPRPDCSISTVINEIQAVELILKQDMKLLTKYDRIDVSDLINDINDIEKLNNAIKDFDVYLSDEELLAIIDKIGKKDDKYLLNILSENAPLSGKALNYFNDKINSLPKLLNNFLLDEYSSFIKSITKATGVSLRKEKEFDVLKRVKQQIVIFTGPISGPISNCWRQGNYPTVLKGIQQLVNKTSLNKNWFELRLVEYSLSAENYSTAIFTLKNIQADKDESMQNYVNLLKLVTQMRMEKREIEDLKLEEIDELVKISKTNTYAGAKAKNMLLVYKDPYEQLSAALNKNERHIESDIKKNNIFISPNPANLNINVQFDYLVSNHITKVKIFNILGNVVKEYDVDLNKNELQNLDIKDLVKGTYVLVAVDATNKSLAQNKFVVIK